MDHQHTADAVETETLMTHSAPNGQHVLSEGKKFTTLTEAEELEIFNAEDTQCGFGGCHPSWLQRLRSKKAYVIVYGLLGMNQFCLGSYMVGTISTMEKQFKISSQTSGILGSLWDVGTLVSFLFTAYFGGKGHKTRWVALGSVVMGFACLMRIIPYLLYGPGEDALKFTEEYGAANNISLAQAMDDLVPLCGEPYTKNQNCDTSSDMLSVVILGVSCVILGIGGSAYWSLGVAYLDDNVRKNKMPVILAFISCIRMVGPTLGFFAASFCLYYYVNPMLTPTIDNSNSQWIGAWWIGWIPIGIINFIFAYFMALFPRSLPRAELRKRMENSSEEKHTEVSFADFKKTLKRLWNNRIYRFNTASSVTYMFGMIGYWTYMPKYMETQFQQSASDANMITGSVGLVCTAMGVLASGALISKFKPPPRYLAAWNVVVELMDALGHFSFTFLGCPDLNIHGQYKTDKTWDTIMSCNERCMCSPSIEYSPVCSVNSNITFFSSCHAGCTNLTLLNGVKTFTNCSCIPSGMATSGVCVSDCGLNFGYFIIVICLLRFFTATGRAGNTIIQFRCVSQEDKAMSIGINEALVCAFAFIPGPVIYGILLDSSCLVWGRICGESGNCWLYKGSHMRLLLNVTSSVFILMAALLDIGVFRNSSHLKMYDDDFLPNKTSKMKSPKIPDDTAKIKYHDKPRLSIDVILQNEDRLSLRRSSLERN